MRSILVTGGAGFLGSHLCERLLERGDEVLCLDNFFTGKKANVAHLLGDPHFELIRHDIVHPIYLEVDQIYNLACPASPVAYQYNPIKTIKTSTVGMVNVLGLAKRCQRRSCRPRPPRSTVTRKSIPKQEDYWGHVNPIGPRSCYDEGKRVAESLCINYHLAHGLEVRLVRIFNTYGPRLDPNDGRVISNFIRQALRGEPLTVYGDGTQTRSFCYVDDLVRGLIAMMDQDDEIGPINLGNPGEYTMLKLAEEVLRAVGSSSSIKHVELPADDPKQRCPDITRARAVLGWSPTVDLKTGLQADGRLLSLADLRARLAESIGQSGQTRVANARPGLGFGRALSINGRTFGQSTSGLRTAVTMFHGSVAGKSVVPHDWRNRSSEISHSIGLQWASRRLVADWRSQSRDRCRSLWATGRWSRPPSTAVPGIKLREGLRPLEPSRIARSTASATGLIPCCPTPRKTPSPARFPESPMAFRRGSMSCCTLGSPTNASN